MRKLIITTFALGLASWAAIAQEQPQTAYAKSDFVTGDEIIFDDTFENEQLGEFPSQWDLLEGYAEIAMVKGRKVIAFTDNGEGQVTPLMKDKWSWLPDVFTVEFDLYIGLEEDTGDDDNLYIQLVFGNRGDESYYNAISYIDLQYRLDGWGSLSWALKKPGSDDSVSGEKGLSLSPDVASDYDGNSPIVPNQWNHFAFSFNKRAFKGYINGVRMINVPIMEAPGYLFFISSTPYKYSGLSNVRIAKGAVPLYDRLASEGKIVTYAITFETGKADLKPESIIEINRIAKLMKEKTDLTFEVQGHCDSTGSDKVNDPLSQKRAEAIVAALVKQGIASDRLTAVGKGSHEPIASNDTDEGRAKNRRVEFVKK